MAKQKDLVKVAKDEGVIAFLKEVAKSGDAILTGALGTEKLRLRMIPGRLFQAARSDEFLIQLASEVEELREKGEIKDDYLNTEQASATLQELLAALEEPPVDERKFNTLKAIFLQAAQEKLSSRDDPTPQLLMNIARQLSSGEILLISSVYRIGKEGVSTEAENSAGPWVETITSKSEIKTKGMVEFYEKSLIKKKLITPRERTGKYGVSPGMCFRLTDLGFKLCQFISED